MAAPTDNKAENVQPWVQAVFSLPHPVEVPVVDDASPDGTADRVEKMAELWEARFGKR